MRLHETVLANQHRDVKYVLQHNDTGRPFIVSAEAAVKEMGSGNYFNWMGPFDEAKVLDHKFLTEDIFRSKAMLRNELPSDEIFVRASKVAKEHGVSLKI